MRLIAICKFKYSDYDNCDKIIESITDWTEVTEEDYNLLVSFSWKCDWAIIERLDKKPGFVLSTVKAAIEEARSAQERLEKDKQEAERKKQERLLKKKAKDEEAEKKLLQTLLVKHGTN